MHIPHAARLAAVSTHHSQWAREKARAVALFLQEDVLQDLKEEMTLQVTTPRRFVVVRCLILMRLMLGGGCIGYFHERIDRQTNLEEKRQRQRRWSRWCVSLGTQIKLNTRWRWSGCWRSTNMCTKMD